MRILEYLNKKIEDLKLLYICLIPFAVALLVGIATMIFRMYFSEYNFPCSNDSLTYINQALDILKGRWLGVFPNGYPLIIVPFTFFPNRDILLSLLNILFYSSVSGLTAFIVNKRTGSKFPALVSGLMVALWFNQIKYAPTILSEPSATFFLVLGIFMIMQNKYSGGLMLGLASVVRTTLLPVGALIAIYKRSYKLFLFFLIPVVIMMGMGYLFAGNFSLGSNLVENIYISAHLSPNGQPLWETPLNLSTIDAVKAYVGVFLDNPINFIYVRAQQFWFLWGFWPATESHSLIVDILLKILIGLRFPLLLSSFLFFFISKRKDSADGLFIIPILVVTIIHTMFFGASRFTYTVEPLLIALFVSHFYFFIQDKKTI